MTVLFMESFTGVNTIAQLAGAGANDAATKWKSDTNPTTYFSLVAGFTNLALKFLGVNSHCIVRAFPSALTTVAIGFKFKPDHVSGQGALCFLGSTNSTLSDQSILIVRNGTELAIITFPGVTTRGQTVGLNLGAGTEYHIELKAVHVSANNWTVVLRVDGVAVLTLGSADYGAASLAEVAFGANSTYATAANDLLGELYVDDADFLPGGGSWTVQCIRPDGAGAHTDWVPDAGSNFSEVNEQSVNDATYVQATNDGDEDTYTYANPTHISGHSVRAVQVCSRAAYLAGAKNLAHVERNGGGTEAQGADKALAASLGFVGTVFNTQSDGSAWGSFNDLDSYQWGRKQRA